MPDNTTGFEFNENPASPNSEASAANLNNAVKKAVIRNIAPNAVTSVHLSASVAGAGLGGGNGSALYVKPDDSTLEIADDKLRLKDGGITSDKLSDGAVTMEKLADAVKSAITDVLKTIYKVGDIFATHDDSNPANRFGGQWERLDNQIIAAANGDHAAGTTSAFYAGESRCLVEKSNAGNIWYNLYSDGWCEQGGYSSDGNVVFPKEFLNDKYGVSAFASSDGTGVDIFSRTNAIRNLTKSGFVAYGYDSTENWPPQSHACRWFACGYAEAPGEDEFKNMRLNARYEYLWIKISDEEEEGDDA